MTEQGPNKSEIQEILRRLRTSSANRMCFDCNAKNPTWASVTYGVFICIDCSAVHRSLGVHLSFVRSTQLDTNWTWNQLCSMKIGGNSNATAFFNQHHCTTPDSQQKYNSRAAQLYREKINQNVAKYYKMHGNKLLSESDDSEVVVEKDADFFEESIQSAQGVEEIPIDSSARLHSHSRNGENKDNVIGPNVDCVLSLSGETAVPSSSQPRKSVIGQRKPAAKLGAKKGGLGAQKVKTDFSEIEREAAMLDQMKERRAEEERVAVERRVEDEEKHMASMKLAYQDLSKVQKQREEQLKNLDPKKAEQVERLGMGVGVRGGISHSAISDMKTIDQDIPSNSRSSMAPRKMDSFFDDFELVENSMGSSMVVGFSKKSPPDWLDYQAAPKKVDELEEMVSRHKTREPSSKQLSPSDGDEARKKFGNAKAISSDQYFSGSRDNDYERRTTLNRFEGQSSISSEDYFSDGRPRPPPQSSSFQSFQNVDLDDVKESVRQGVTKVAGKLSNLANGMMSSLQDKYGY